MASAGFLVESERRVEIDAEGIDDEPVVVRREVVRRTLVPVRVSSDV